LPRMRNAHRDTALPIRDIPELHPHELRHTAASLAIASGADVKVVQQMLGHSSTAMTMDVYGHLFSDRLDEVADALDAARSEAARSAAGVDTAQNPVAKVFAKRRSGRLGRLQGER
jgi:site-specific recombinase XerC